MHVCENSVDTQLQLPYASILHEEHNQDQNWALVGEEHAEALWGTAGTRAMHAETCERADGQTDGQGWLARTDGQAQVRGAAGAAWVEAQ